MTKPELDQAWRLAQSDADLSAENLDIFDGFGLPGFQPVYCTQRQVARLIRWQCQYMNGEWDMAALNEIARCGRRGFQILSSNTPGRAEPVAA